ncbi:CocE/NonD family hydrolase [soil metagenome]
MAHGVEATRGLREIDHVWIPMSDGVRLAMRIWLPDDAEDHPVPAILEYIPYRKNDGTYARDAGRQRYFAQHGYAAARVDLRGSGDSEGLLLDEYLQLELDDACEVIAWLADQPWCTGSVGMAGISWGGFNALQVAAMRPPALKAIISVCSTDDRYADDVHYHGGCVVGSDMLSWASTMLVAGARPPDPLHVGEGWRDAWLERLGVTPFVEAWLTHQRREEFWRHGSVIEDYAAMDCAVCMVGGWDDAYRDAILRVLTGYEGPRRGLIGPWGHTYPDNGVPGAPIDFLAESVRFWDHWLKDVPNGIMDEPMLQAFITEEVGDGVPGRREGTWVSEQTWPTPNVAVQRWAIGKDLLGDPDPAEACLDVMGSLQSGGASGAYMGLGVPADLPGDQGVEDVAALCFDSTALAEPVTVLGQADVVLDVAVDRPLALLAVRLCEVDEAGASRLVARGLLNLSHRNGHTELAPMVPGERTEVTVRLSAAGHTFRAGSRLRVAVSPTYWPWAWPSPEPVMLSVFTGGASALRLPVRAAREDDGEPPCFVWRDPVAVTPNKERTVTNELVGDRAARIVQDVSEVRTPSGLVLYQTARDTFTITDGDPLSATVRCERSASLDRGDWRVHVETTSTMTADATDFHLSNVVTAYEADVEVFTRTWTTSIPRDHV